MGWESFGVVGFDLGPFLRVFSGKPTYRKSWAKNLFMWSDLTLNPLFQGQTRIPKLKSAYISLIIGPRGLQCETNL